MLNFLRKFLFSALFILLFTNQSLAAPTRTIENLEAKPPIHIRNFERAPSGLTPSQIKNIYHLPQVGGYGTIAIVDAYDFPTAESDLKVFDKQFGLPDCTKKNKCLKVHKMMSDIKEDSGWAQEAALDTQWAHAIAPNAKILLVEAKSANGIDLLKAVDYARKQKDVVAVSMSWGGAEFSGSDKFDKYFKSEHAITFFASSGDNGTGVQWPAVSPNVVAVGGTTLHLSKTGNFISETAWNGSGGGISSFIKEPIYQNALHVLKNNGMRSVPDVSYNADPQSGFSVYHNGWMIIGGTSAGSPQWAAIQSLGKNISNTKLYNDAAADYGKYFRDILKGINGDCGILCKARKNYDTVTGLGSPLTILF